MVINECNNDNLHSIDLEGDQFQFYIGFDGDNNNRG